ncbi:MAG: 4Fe-4S dicluster domain-containing protein [Firmicutes bacterium]|nr:4Fe-4S dicluster domain-containing protein [Bacillota bacterium]
MSDLEEKKISRRRFIKGASGAVAGAMGVTFVGHLFGLNERVFAFSLPDSEGYLLVDDSLCQNCKKCMAVCSLYNEGEVNFSLSRIQIADNPFYIDQTIGQCRQCVDAPCVEICPTKANHVDPKVLNRRTIDKEKCLGCRLCQEACPFEFARLQYGKDQKMRKCTLCDGEPQCAKNCPTTAIRFIKGPAPYQRGDSGYRVDFRSDFKYDWARQKWDIPGEKLA